MITIKNTQHTIPVNIKQLKQDAQNILNLLNYPNFDLGIWLTTNKTIRKYNRTYRKKNKSTDILSFPYWPELNAGERIQAKSDDEKNLGDLIISLEYVKKDAPKWGHTFDQRMRVLLVHGICHLLGYDHAKDDDYDIMRKQEEYLLQKLKEQ